MKQKQKSLDISKARVVQDESNYDARSVKSVLFSRGKKTETFFTEDSRLYVTPREQILIRKGINLDRGTRQWDSLSSRIVSRFVYQKPMGTSILLRHLENRYSILNASIDEASQGFADYFSVVRLWNLSIVGSILFGMVTMTFIYRYLGQGAAADQLNAPEVSQELIQAEKVLGADVSSNDAVEFTKQIMQIQEENDQKKFEKELKEMVKGHPIEKMVPYIIKKDRITAAFIVAIARKESNWGKRRPVLNGQDCYNYWGYRGQRKLMGSGGHTCFNSPQDAVDTIAKRLDTLIKKDGRNTPSEMVIWKCGSNCSVTGGQAAANKWISDVEGIFEQLNID